MPTLSELVENLGGAVVELVVAPQGMEMSLGRLVVYDAGEHLGMGAGDVVLGVGLRPGRDMTTLLQSMLEAGAAVLLLKGAASHEVAGDAQRAGVALLAVPTGTPWAHVVTLVSSVLAADRFSNHGEQLGDTSAGDLFAVADAIADILGAPITIEDPQSALIAFSGRQDEADPARIATILGRRVPEAYRRTLEQSGLMRRIFSEPGPVYCPSRGPDGMPRAAVAVRAGREVLGTIWAAIPEQLDAEREKILVDASHFVALHLLRHKVAADARRGLEADLIAAVLLGGSLATEASQRLEMRGPQFRVIAVGVGGEDGEDRDIQLLRCRDLLELHLAAVYRGARTMQSRGVVYSVIPARAEPNAALAALRPLLGQYVARVSTLIKTQVLVGIGTQVDEVAEIPASRGAADKVLRVLRLKGGRSIADIDEVRADALLLDFAATFGDHPAMTGGPLQTLRSHDAQHNTRYAETVSAYLDAFGDVHGAAELLGIHANTVRYRLKQMESIIDLGLDDPAQRLVLLLQLRVPEAPRAPDGRTRPRAKPAAS